VPPVSKLNVVAFRECGDDVKQRTGTLTQDLLALEGHEADESAFDS
jgi:hypothetical protein